MEKNFWKKLKRPIFVAAPMSGVTDEPFRLMFFKRSKPAVFWTEFVATEGLFSRGKDYCLKLLEFSKKERPIVAQIFGDDPMYFKKAAELIADLGFDGIDINMGCPDKAIEKQGAGAALIKNPSLAREIIRETKHGAGKLPVSVKTRIGYEKDETDQWIPLILKEKPAALTVHFRTKKELYFAPAHWELAKKIVKLRDRYSPETIILGNGDVKSLQDAKRLAKETGLDGIMIGRAVLGNPWFFLKKTPTIKERLKTIVEHAKTFEEFHKKDIKNGKCKQFESIKKHFHAYTKGFRGAKELREQLMKVKNLKETKEVIENFLKEKK